MSACKGSGRRKTSGAVGDQSWLTTVLLVSCPVMLVGPSCAGCPGDTRQEAVPSSVSGAQNNFDGGPNITTPATPTVSIPSVETDASTTVAPLRGTTEGCPAGMARIEGGTFGQRKNRKVKPFCMQRTEVTLARYAECVAAGGCEAPAQGEACNWGVAGRESHPINCVTYKQASTYCNWIGARLPSEDEWEWAARGRSAAMKYPWGDVPPSKQLCWSGAEPRTSTCPVRSFPEGDSPDGISDLSGNVSEWTSTRGPARSERSPFSYVVRGGWWSMDIPDLFRADVTNFSEPASAFDGRGFRCVADMNR